MPSRSQSSRKRAQVEAELQLAATSSAPQSVFAPVVLADCWLDSALEHDLLINVRSGQSIREAFTSQNVKGFNPDWLFDVGHYALDAAGSPLISADSRASSSGSITWNPPVRLHRLDDQTDDDRAVGSSERNKRLAGEVLVACLWRQAANPLGLDNSRIAQKINGNTRGANFRKDLTAFLSASLPGWEFPHEKPLSEIYGLHLRQDVGERRSDILALDGSEPRRRLMAVISSKWSWRSDRGTEAAQMIPLRKYRPDLPYVIATSEFPRARVVGRESVEDSAYHLAPDWVAAWLTLYQEWGAADWSTLGLASAYDRGQPLRDALGLGTLSDLASSLRQAGNWG